VNAAVNFGIRCVLVRHNQITFKDSSAWQCQPDVRADNVEDAVRYILNEQ
jgi:hypothetical protein